MKNTINLRMAFFGLPAYNVIDEPQRNTASMPIFRLGGFLTAYCPCLTEPKGSSAAKYVSDGDKFWNSV